MTVNVIMPQGGQDLETGTVVRWLKNEGDPVNKGEVICEVETEKAVFEVNAPSNGVLLKIVVPEGVATPIFSTIGIIGELDESASIAEAEMPVSAEYQTAQHVEQTVTVQDGGKEAGVKILISPKARKIADEKGVPLEKLKGSGPQGRIVEKDVLAFLEAGKASSRAVSEPENEPKILPMSKTRKVTARRMQQSKQTIPHFYVTVTVDMTNAAGFRETLNSKNELLGITKVSVTDLITRACVLALLEFPQLICSVKDDDKLEYWKDINIGIAAALEDGLTVPVLESANKLDLNQIAQTTQALIRMAKEGKQPSLAPGRFTISNLGMYDIDNFIAIINPPEIAILAVSSIEKKVVPVDGNTIGIRDIMNMTLSIDHRAGDGVLAAKFLNKTKYLLENPDSLTLPCNTDVC